MTLSEAATALLEPEQHAPASGDVTSVATPPARRPSDAGQGIAQTTHAPHRCSGDPDLSDRTNVVAQPSKVLSGHDGGHPGSEHRSASAAVTPSDPALLATSTNQRVRGGRGSLEEPALHSTSAAAQPSGPAIERPSSDDALRDRGDGPKRKAPQSRAAIARTSGPANDQVQPEHEPLGLGDGHPSHDALPSVAVATPSAPAFQGSVTEQTMPGQGDGRYGHAAHVDHAVATSSAPAKSGLKPDPNLPGQGDGHSPHDAHLRSAVATSSAPAIHAPNSEAPLPEQGDAVGVATLVDLWRQRVDLRRAETRLHLQAMAVCRRALGGDKEAAQKLWKAIQKGTSDRADVAMVVEPYRLAAATLDHSATLLEKELCKRVRKLPLWTGWAVDVRGLGELSLAGLIGEAAGQPGMYRSVSALWKRFGLAVFDGERQRRHSDAQMALLHGYAPQRRAFAYVLSANLMKSQRAEDPYRVIYDARKAYELGRDIPKAHAHNRALRIMVKELLKDAYAADRRAS